MSDGGMVSGMEEGCGLPDRLTPSPSPQRERGASGGDVVEDGQGPEARQSLSAQVRRTSGEFSVRGVSGRMRGNARVLRRYQTPAEATLWTELRGRKIDGLKFRRQCAIDPFIADFLCYECALIIEVDGAQHADVHVREYDNDVRTRYLNEQGFEVLRFTNADVEKPLDSVVERIAQFAPLRRNPSPLSPEVVGPGVRR